MHRSFRYLFRCSGIRCPYASSSPALSYFPEITITDLISNLSCHVTLNNNWSVIFSHLVSMYASKHPFIQTATNSILHWAVKRGFTVPPPPIIREAESNGINSMKGSAVEYPRYYYFKNGGKADTAPPPTHANLSVVLVLWLRFLMDTYPQVLTASELILEHLDLPHIELTDSVESILFRFFDFYQSVDFLSSVISIRSRAAPLNRLSQISGFQSGSCPTSLVVVDPIIDR